MVSRRGVLAVGATAVAGGFGGCAASGRDGQPVRFEGEIAAPPIGGGVASDDATAGGEPRGDVRLRADVYEREDGRLLAFSTLSVFSGATRYDSRWTYGPLSVVHDWSTVAGAVVETGTDLAVLEGGKGREPQATLRLEGDGSRRRWSVSFPAPVANGFVYRFRSVFDPTQSPGEGDALATVAGRATVSNGTPVVGEGTVETAASLAYGDENDG